MTKTTAHPKNWPIASYYSDNILNSTTFSKPLLPSTILQRTRDIQ